MLLFGTTDYKSVLEELSPSDGMVKEFHRLVAKHNESEANK